jgi:hypothetical protein
MAWEVQFGNQMAEVLDILRRVDEKTQQQPRGQPLEADSPMQHLESNVDVPAVLLALKRSGIAIDDVPGGQSSPDYLTSTSLRSLIQSSQPVSLSELAQDMQISLVHNRTGTAVRIRMHLLETLWKKSWKPEALATANSIATLDAIPGVERPTLASHLATSFKFHEFGAREDAISPAILQTYAWIFNRHASMPGGASWSSFPAWLERPLDPIYWITGKPGSGKSTIMKYLLGDPRLLRHLTNWAGGVPILMVRYYAWNAGATLQRSSDGLKRTMIFQALVQCPELLPAVVPRRWAYSRALQGIPRDLPAPTEWEVDEAFEALMSRCGTEMALALFIDGLDEFEADPRHIVSLIESITASAHGRIKVCVASRPWVEFDDVYRDVPQLQMDLLTKNDMTTFVTERFRACRAIRDYEAYYPAKTAQLLDEAVKKASGVFIWLRVVVETLVESATEGSGILELQATLDSLPADISKLYDAIWARIPVRSQKRGAIMIRIVLAMHDLGRSTDSSLVWLADDFALKKRDNAPRLGSMGDSQVTYDHIRLSLKRKLASATRGLLEITGNPRESCGQVTVTHRTAMEWARQPEVSTSLAKQCGEEFEPYLCLLEMFTLRMSCDSLAYPSYQTVAENDFWADGITQAFLCACRASRVPENIGAMTCALDAFDRSMRDAVRAPRARDLHVYSLEDWPSSIHGRGNSLIGFAAQFGVCSYVMAKASQNRAVLYQRASYRCIGPLESAIFGYNYFDRRTSAWDPNSVTFTSDRLELVKFLLEHGVEQSQIYATRYGQPSLRDEVRKVAAECLSEGKQGAYDYFSNVSALLGGNAVRTAFRSASMWLKSIRYKG